MLTSAHPPKALGCTLSPPVAAHVEAPIASILRSYSRFSRDDALVNDQLRDYWRKPAIREWATRAIIGQA